MKAGGNTVEVVRMTITEGRPAGSRRPAATRLRSMPTSPSHPVHPNSKADRYHQKQRERRRKTNRICIHLNTTSPALGTKSPRTHSDNVPVPIVAGPAICLLARSGSESLWPAAGCDASLCISLLAGLPKYSNPQVG
jgi:hypothetical protein